MNEKIKDTFEYLKKYENLTPDAIDDLHYLEGTIESLQQKVEQLENIRKEAIEYIENNSYFESNIVKTMVLGDYSSDLLNILNKGYYKN